MIDNMVDISKEQLLVEVQNMLFDDYRFVTATSVDNADGSVDIIYHFDKDLVMKHFKITVKKGEEVPSISKIYFCAILVENEIKELFGVNITNIAIDYGGRMLLSDDDLDSPMGRQQIVIEERKGTK